MAVYRLSPLSILICTLCSMSAVPVPRSGQFLQSSRLLAPDEAQVEFSGNFASGEISGDFALGYEHRPPVYTAQQRQQPRPYAQSHDAPRYLSEADRQRGWHNSVPRPRDSRVYTPGHIDPYRSYPQSHFTERSRGQTMPREEHFHSAAQRHFSQGDVYGPPIGTRTHRNYFYNAESQADLAADMRNSMYDLPDLPNRSPPPSKVEHTSDVIIRNPDTPRDRLPPAGRSPLQIDPSVSLGLQTLARSLDAESISVSRSVMDKSSSAQNEPMYTDTLFNFLMSLAQRVKGRHSGTSGSNAAFRPNVWNESTAFEQHSNFAENKRIKKKQKSPENSIPLRSRDSANKKRKPERSTADTTSETSSKASGQTKTKAEKRIKPTIEGVMNNDVKPGQVVGNNPIGRKTDTIVPTNNVKSKYKSKQKPKLIQTESTNDLTTVKDLTSKIKGSVNKVSDIAKVHKNEGQTHSVASGGQASKKVMDLTNSFQRAEHMKSASLGKTSKPTKSNPYVSPFASTLQDFASVITNGHKTGSQPERTKYVFVMVDSNGAVKPFKPSPNLLSHVSEISKPTDKLAQKTEKGINPVQRKGGKKGVKTDTANIDSRVKTPKVADIKKDTPGKYKTATSGSNVSSNILKQTKKAKVKQSEVKKEKQATDTAQKAKVGKITKTGTKQNASLDKKTMIGTKQNKNLEKKAKTNPKQKAKSGKKTKAKSKEAATEKEAEVPENVTPSLYANANAGGKIHRGAKPTTPMDLEAMQAAAEQQLALWNSAVENFDFFSFFS